MYWKRGNEAKQHGRVYTSVARISCFVFKVPQERSHRVKVSFNNKPPSLLLKPSITVFVHLISLREVPDPGLVGHKGHGSSILLPVGWLGQVDLFKLERVLRLQIQENKELFLEHSPHSTTHTLQLHVYMQVHVCP